MLHRRSLSQAGFTLLELTISITLLAVVVVIVVGAMRIGMRSVESGERKIESLERLRSSMSILDAQIQSHIPLTYVQEGEGTSQFYFKGERESLQFATNYSVWGGQRGFVLASYSVLTDDRGRRILSVSENIINMEGKRETKLFDSFDQIYFEYLYRDPMQEEGQWVDRWTETSLLPEKIRVHFVQGVQDASLVIPLRVRGALDESGFFVEEEEE
ncbi:MAG: prepilin-type N-terminal cleavage/methylation domain-containing protein [Nitrospirota bacterium]